MNKIKQRTIYILLVAIIIFFASVFACKFDDLLFKSKPVQIGANQFDALSKGKVCDDKDQCIDAFISIGAINNDLLKSFKSKRGELKTAGLPICFTSGGGRDKIAWEISQIIKAEKLSTCVASRYIVNDSVIKLTTTDTDIKTGKVITLDNPCLSACPFIFMSGEKRFALGTNFTIGLHKPATIIDLCICTIPVPFIDASENEFIASIISSTVNEHDRLAFEKYYAFSLKTPSKDMYMLSHEQHKTYRLFNHSFKIPSKKI